MTYGDQEKPRANSIGTVQIQYWFQSGAFQDTSGEMSWIETYDSSNRSSMQCKFRLARGFSWSPIANIDKMK